LCRKSEPNETHSTLSSLGWESEVVGKLDDEIYGLLPRAIRDTSRFIHHDYYVNGGVTLHSWTLPIAWDSEIRSL
jgi:hypothetical protein